MSKKPTCPKCGSDNVVADAAARWNPTELEGDPDESEGWEISNVFDNGHGCDDCGAEDIQFVWIDLTTPPTLTSPHPAEGLGSGITIAPDDSASHSYRVTWMIDVEADSPQAAAVSARATQLHRNSIATIFTVQSRDGTTRCIDTDDIAAQPFLVPR